MAARATPSAAMGVRDEEQNGGDDRGLDLVGGNRISAPPPLGELTQGEYSPEPKKSRRVNTKSEHSPREIASQKVVDLAAFKAKVTIHSSAVFETGKWKRSRVKKGWLIARIKGYDPVESEYGVHYLKVLGRRPKKTSGDYSLYEHAGFFTWDVLQAAGRLVRERKRHDRISDHRANAS